jgi:hypothetical protein
MLEFGRSIPVGQVRRAIADNASATGLRTNESGKRPVLSDLLRERAPQDVVRHLYPDLLSKTVGAYFHPIDMATHRQAIAPHSTATAIAIALVFSRASDALAAFQLAQPTAVASRPSLTEVFLRHKGDTREVARSLGMSEADARMRLRGISRQIKPRIQAELRALNLYRSGMPLSAACKELGADRELADNLIRSRLRPTTVRHRKIRAKSTATSARA